MSLLNTAESPHFLTCKSEQKVENDTKYKVKFNYVSHKIYINDCRTRCDYTGCNTRNGPDFGRVFLMLNYTEKPQNTYIQSLTVSEIMASEV